MARKQKKQIFRYKCSITEEEFKTTQQAKNPEELVSVMPITSFIPIRMIAPKRSSASSV